MNCNETVTCSVNMKKIGKQLDLGLFVVLFYSLHSILLLEISRDLSQNKFISIVHFR